MTYTLIHNGTLIDGTGASPIEKAAILIENNRIRAAGPQKTISRPGGEAIELDAQGGFIMPGFIDAHVHLMLEEVNLIEILTTPFSFNFYQAIDRMRRTLEAGVTTVRDAGGADVGLKQAVERELAPGPRMQLSVTILSTTGGHLDFWLPSGTDLALLPSYPGRPDGICDGVEAVRQKVRQVLRAGAEVIKVCATGGVMSPTDHPEFTQFTEEELAVMVQEGAYRRGVKVMAHAQGNEGVKNALRAGIHSIEHGIYLDDEAIELMLQGGTYLVPTLLAGVAVMEAAEAGAAVPEWALTKGREVIEAQSQSIAQAYQAGVKIAMGTDAGVMPHGTNLRELGLMCQIGMSPMEAIVATTRVAAECLGWQDQVGTIEPGKLADIVISKTDPLADIRSLEQVDNIVVVMKDGRVFKDLRF